MVADLLRGQRRLVGSGDVGAEERSRRIRLIRCIRTPFRLWGRPSQAGIYDDGGIRMQRITLMLRIAPPRDIAARHEPGYEKGTTSAGR